MAATPAKVQGVARRTNVARADILAAASILLDRSCMQAFHGIHLLRISLTWFSLTRSPSQ
jgi:hypothetical protein